MASIELYVAFSGETIPVYDVDLESVTALEIVEAAKEAGVLPPLPYFCFNTCEEYKVYLLIGKKDPIPIRFDEREKSLSELGFSDGDIIHVVGRPM